MQESVRINAVLRHCTRLALAGSMTAGVAVAGERSRAARFSRSHQWFGVLFKYAMQSYEVTSGGRSGSAYSIST
jgi:hypothetical protein